MSKPLVFELLFLRMFSESKNDSSQVASHISGSKQANTSLVPGVLWNTVG
jgi:hypothetical protein